MDKKLGVWKKAGEKAIIKKANISQPEIGKVIITFEYDIPGDNGEKIAGYATTYTVFSSADVIIKNQFSKVSDRIPETPRMGMQMQLPEEFMNLKWWRGLMKIIPTEKHGDVDFMRAVLMISMYLIYVLRKTDIKPTHAG
jgi:hypothetical protein